jgi:hypothetical protein
MSNLQMFAVFIDGDNISPRHIPRIFEILKQRGGRVTIKRVYGDFSEGEMKFWKPICLQLNLDPIQVWRLNGKNSTDHRIVGDCIELVHSKNAASNFVLVTGDGDYISLITKIRESGNTVIGISQSEKATSKHLPNACDEFLFLEPVTSAKFETPSPTSSEEESSISPPTSNKSALIGGSNAALISESKGKTGLSYKTIAQMSSPKKIYRPRRMLRMTRPDLERAVVRVIEQSGKGALNMGALKERLLVVQPTFSETNFGHESFASLIGTLRKVRIVRRGDRNLSVVVV